ncbi:hypothetical protein [Paenibacillus paridis]|uniref:hypothetical protein n=1 Tax=Paenibacillus paridis TaxID=2583376 RepID=UPI001120F80A|nr:hypothetical protein [Paenibacillus paridis]
MFGRLICVLVLAAAMLACDIPKFKIAAPRDRVVYGALFGILTYLSFLFVASIHGPNVDSVFNLLAAPAKQIIQWIDPAKSSS